MRSSAVQTPDLITHFIPRLNDLEITYMVTGAVAAVIYGEPRLTRDLDLVMTLDPAEAGRLAGAFDHEFLPGPVARETP